MVAFEGFANMARIIQVRDALFEVVPESLADLGIEFLDRFLN